MLPNDEEKPNTTSGIRMGFAALTTRGLKEDGGATSGADYQCFLY